MNKLKNEKSQYLRDSSNQPVNWYPWGREAFELAKKENKPILVDVGASWCHWCHVMDEQNYNNEEIAKIINDNFIAIKVDRDEMPSVDRKLQIAISSLFGQGGWPLTVFMTPDKRVFYGGTYFPPEDSFNMIGFKKVLLEIIRLWKEEKDKIINNSLSLVFGNQNNIEEGKLNSGFIDQINNYIYTSYDLNYGGIDSDIKFPHPTVDIYMLSQYYRKRNNDGKKYLDAVTLTLKQMFYGGIFDQVSGGFHRYSTDRYWKVPHFEKLSIDNAEILIDYYNAYILTKDDEIYDALMMITNFILNELKIDDGFANSIDADSEGIEGKYYTYSEEEFKDALDDLFDISVKIFDFYNLPEIEGRKVLSRKMGIDELSHLLNSREKAWNILNEIRKRLKNYKTSWKKPLRDENLYTYQNARVAEALLITSPITNKGIDESLSVIKKLRKSGRRINDDNEKIIDDISSSLSACLTAYEVVGDQSYLYDALSLFNELMEYKSDVGFKEKRGKKSNDEENMIYFSDSPNESPNSIAIKAWLKLYQSGRAEIDEKMIKTLPSIIEREPVFHAGLSLSIESLINGIAHIVIIDEKDGRAEKLHKASLLTYYPLKFVEVISDDRRDELPSYIKQMINYGNRSRIYVCKGKTCSMPIYNENDLKNIL
ncbi:thioredoxin domain protein [Caldisphaera lagunensis DSM 15908]|uniref:Thioredoxin domain protein n=1 Tax=Caldisphaera lagunensis (strain DSM 15908 / JCM 11604 / ANMR 0165 / IC-154) TaxID=1056495 RepID=L0AC29_CALLD|nr:thioredoxin domain-containing protein [Caldisphaera lagunensis]AFZ70590.1 thioredoxin domain protein [Caldisphaera lagunensis DSM 15908]